jgi:hypothetical protein
MESYPHAKGLFIDWLTVWQVHPEHAPLNSGSIVTFNNAGAPVFSRTRAARISGSHATSCTFKSDGRSVVASGNFGRLNREDNLFNFDPYTTLQRVNACAEFAGLPLFSIAHQRNSSSAPVSASGALEAVRSSGNETLSGEQRKPEPLHLSRIDLTRNYKCGSLAAARAVIRSIQGKTIARIKKGVGGDTSVWWSNTRYMLKVYIKSLEMESHGTNSGEAYEYARDNGIIRLEIELKRRELNELGWADFSEFLKAWNMGQVHKLFSDYEKVLEVNKVNNDAAFIDSLPQRLRVVAATFLSGRDVRSLMKKTTFYKYRKALLEYGIDLADERPALISSTVREIEIIPVEAPDWYWNKVA